MPGVPSSPSGGPRPDRHDPASDDEGPDDDDPDRSTWLPRRLWPTVLVAGILTWLAFGVALLLLAAAGAPVPPAASDARSTLPWLPQDAWSVAAGAGWVATVSVVAAWFLRSGLRRRGVHPLPAPADLTVIVAVGVVLSMVLWPRAFPELSKALPTVGAMLIVILLLRVREVWVGRDLLGPRSPRGWAVAVLILVVLVAPYAAWHPLSVRDVEVRATGGTVSGGEDSDGSADGDEGEARAAGDPRTSEQGDPVRVQAGPGRTVTLRFDVLADTGGVRLRDATPMVPTGAFALLPVRPPDADGTWRDGAPLPRRLAHREDSGREFRLRARAPCDGREQRIDRLRVRYERYGATITTELATGAPVTLVCVGRR